LLTLKQVCKSYGKTEVLRDVSLDIKEGEIFGIVGESGVGKSTLLRCLNGLEPYDSGSTTVFGKEVSNLRGEELRQFRRSIGMIFQQFALLERRDVFGNIALPMECWGYSKEYIENKVLESAKIVGIFEKLKNRPLELSGGQRQRVAIARALALSPKVLLCDEATSALDPNTTRAILELIKKINDELKITVVMVTHEMGVVKNLCHRAALMEGGRIVETGLVEDLFLRPSAALNKLLGDEEVLPTRGVNIRLFFDKEHSNQCFITSMSRELGMDFSIVWGKLEKFRGDVLGSLVINVEEVNLEIVTRYLKNKSLSWEVISYGI